MKRVILHLGFQKTASTSFQALLDANRQRLGLGIYAYGTDTQPLRTLALSIAHNPTPVALRSFSYAMSGCFQETLKNGHESTIISDENLVGRTLYNREGNLASWSETILPLIAKALPDDLSAEIIFYTRDHAAWLRSLHGQCIKRAKERRGYEGWIKDCPIDTNWDALHDTMVRAASPIQVRFVAMEDDLMRDGFVGSTVLRTAGVSDKLIADLQIPEPKNRALHKTSLALLRCLNHVPMPLRRRLQISEAIEKFDNSVRAR